MLVTVYKKPMNICYLLNVRTVPFYTSYNSLKRLILCTKPSLLPPTKFLKLEEEVLVRRVELQQRTLNLFYVQSPHPITLFLLLHRRRCLNETGNSLRRLHQLSQRLILVYELVEKVKLRVELVPVLMLNVRLGSHGRVMTCLSRHMRCVLIMQFLPVVLLVVQSA
jgi:hypothetical protein